MKYIKRIIILLLFFLIITAIFPIRINAEEMNSIGGVIESQEIDYVLPYPGMLPDNPLYFIKEFRDQLLIKITRNYEKKSGYLLLIGDKDIVMARMMCEKKEYLLCGTFYVKAEENLLSSIIETGKNTNVKSSSFTEKLSNSQKKHEEILNKADKYSQDEKLILSIEKALSINNQAKQQLLKYL